MGSFRVKYGSCDDAITVVADSIVRDDEIGAGRFVHEDDTVMTGGQMKPLCVA